MNRKLWAHQRPYLACILLITLLLTCLGGFSLDVHADTKNAHAVAYSSQDATQDLSALKEEFKQIGANMDRSSLPQSKLCEFIGHHESDRRPSRFLLYIKHRAQAPPSNS